MAVGKDKWDDLAARMESLQIREDDLIEKFIMGSGKGGQKVNKTSSCVYLRHGPTGFEIKCQRDRSRELNRYYARKELCEKVEESVLKNKSAKQQAFEKIRRQKRKRSKRAQEKMLEGKRHHAEKKQSRSVPKSGAEF